MAGKREVKVVISGDSSGAQRALHQVDTSGDKTASHAAGVSAKIGGSFGKLGNLIGGEFGEVLSKISEGFDATGEHGLNMGKKLMAAGGVVTAAGAALTLGGSNEKQAQDQLSSAIDATGNAASDYKDKIEAAVRSGEKYAHGAADTKGALAALTLATQDPTKAIADMTVVENLAAQKHESLTEAAGQLAKVYAGSGKILKQYGITLDSTKSATSGLASAETQHQAAVDRLAKAQRSLADIEAVDGTRKKLTIGQEIQLRNAREAVSSASDNLKTKTQNLTVAQDRAKDSTHFADDALGQLNARLSGQASASVDNWGGKISVARTKLSDWTAEMGQRFGPAITATGPVMIAAGMAMDLYASHVDKVALHEAALAAEAATTAGEVAASDAGMIAEAEAANAGISAALGPIGIVGAIVGVVGAAAIATHGFGLFGGGAKAQIKPVDDLTQAILADKDAVGQLTAANVNKKLSDAGAYDAGLKLGISQDIVRAATMGNANAQKVVTDAINKAEGAAAKATGTVTTFGSASRAGGAILIHQATPAQKEAAAAAEKLASSTGLVTGQLVASHRAADNQTIAMRSTTLATTSTEAAVNRLSAALHLVPHDVKSQVSQTGAAEVKKAIAQIPKSWISRGLVTADVSGAIATLHYLQETALQVASAMPVGSMTESPQHAARAAGGRAGGRTIVGEQGFEIVDLPTGSYVNTHAQSMAMMSAAPAASAAADERPIEITINQHLDGDKIHTSLLKLKRHRGVASLGI